MNISHPDRKFQIWAYNVSHGTLLLRSPRSEASQLNVDLLFSGVEFVLLPRYLNGITFFEMSVSDNYFISEHFGELKNCQKPFKIKSKSKTYYIIAAACHETKNDMDIFELPKQFE